MAGVTLFLAAFLSWYVVTSGPGLVAQLLG
jgi:hypothetical protein